MKKITLFVIIAWLSCGFTFGQITLNDVPSIGDNFYRGNDTLSRPLNVGNSGTGQTWDFTGLLTEHTKDTTSFMDPAMTPFAAQFPAANMAIQTQGFLGYLNKNTSMLEELGGAGDIVGNGNPIMFKYNQPLTSYIIPSNYNTSFVDTAYGWIILDAASIGAGGFGIDSVKIKHIVQRNSNFDGSGTLLGFVNTYTNVVREKKLENTIDSVWLKGAFLTANQWVLPSTTQFGAFVPDEQITFTSTYNWFVSGTKLSVLTVTLNENDSTTAINFPTQTLNSLTTPQFNTSTVYPNPAKDLLTVQFANLITENTTLNVFNVVGQKVKVNSKLNSNSFDVNTSTLENGVYFYQVVQNNKVVSTGKFVISK